MYPRLAGAFLFQGLSGTLKETFESKVRVASGHVDALSEDDVLKGDPNELARGIVAKLLAAKVVMSCDPPEMVGEPVEKTIPENRNISEFHFRFLLKAVSEDYYFRMPLGINGPRIFIPAQWTTEGFVLEVITRKMEDMPIRRLLGETRQQLNIMIEEVNFLVDHYNGELRSAVPQFVLDRREKIKQTRTFKSSLNFPKYQAKPQPAPVPMIPDCRKVFLSYSHEDEDQLNKLRDHLSLLSREKFIKTWDDQVIPAGGDIDACVIRGIEEAHIIMLLVSSGFMRSDYIWKHEVSRAMARHEAGTAIVIPIILKPCDFETASFAKVKCLPKDRKPVTLWTNQDAAFKDIAVEVRRLVTPKSQ